jgi:hypothetical protein
MINITFVTRIVGYNETKSGYGTETRPITEVDEVRGYVNAGMRDGCLMFEFADGEVTAYNMRWVQDYNTTTGE